jgi:TRAP-type uncharacterized transport system substrate-binding protein
MKKQKGPSSDKLQGTGSPRTLRDLLSIYGFAIVLTVAGFIVAWQFVEPAPDRHLVMATGPQDGAYHRYGLRYRDVLARHGIELELLTTAGSVENLELLADPDKEVELILLQGGIGDVADTPGIKALASLFYEPLWIFQREKITTTVPDLTSRRVAIGERGSGTHAAFRRLIENNDLPTTAFHALEMGGTSAAEALLSGQVDVACFVASIEAPYIRRLLLSEEVHLTPFVRAEAYIRHEHSFAKVLLPRGAADLRRDVPSSDVILLAPVASLTASEKLHPNLVAVLVEAAMEIHSPGGIFEAQGQFPSALNTTFPMHEDAQRYLENGPPWLQRYLPFWAAVSIDRLTILLIPLATLLIPLFKIAPPTYRWRVRKRIYSHYRYLFDVETALLNHPDREVLDLCTSKIDRIERELSEVNVPLSYADQLYHLRMHVRFVKQRVDQVRQTL